MAKILFAEMKLMAIESLLYCKHIDYYMEEWKGLKEEGVATLELAF